MQEFGEAAAREPGRAPDKDGKFDFRAPEYMAMQIGSDAVTSTSSVSDEAHLETLCQLLHARATDSPDRLAFSFLADEGEWAHVTDRQLARSALAVAARIRQHAEPGDRVILSFPPGLEFISAFFGCLLAGTIAVPATYPRPRRPESRLTQILDDCQARVGLTNRKALGWLDEQIGDRLVWLEVPDPSAVEGELKADAGEGLQDELWSFPNPHDAALLQYTSGSTAEPKGVIVTHRNLMHNLEVIAEGFQRDAGLWEGSERIGVFWLPAYHDMGLVGTILMPFYAQWRSVLMPPTLFLRRPELWLQTISDLRAALTGAPNFALDRCVDKVPPAAREKLDLSCLRLLFCGAEPIRVSSVARFSESFAAQGLAADVWYPCYGMAECTLMASGPAGPGPLRYLQLDPLALREHRIQILQEGGLTDSAARWQFMVPPSPDTSSPDSPSSDPQATPQRAADRNAEAAPITVANCGVTHGAQQAAIVDPKTERRCEEQVIGEIWLSGESVAAGYWNRPELSAEVFAAEIRDMPEHRWLRTGDLGFVHQGELFITGREKDVMIVRGQNFYPQDIEHVVSLSHAALPADSSAAFAIDAVEGEGVVVVQELDRQHRDADLEDVHRRIRNAVAERFELELAASVLIRQASLPRTTSGKVQRKLCRKLFEAEGLAVISSWERPLPAASGAISGTPDISEQQTSDELAPVIEAWLLDWIRSRCGEAVEQLDRDTPLSQSGLDSIAAVEMSLELERWLQIEITPALAWEHPTAAELARALADETLRVREAGDE